MQHVAFSGANLVTEINIEFRPEQANGILLLSGERDDLNGDFMIVTLTNGIIEFFFDCGSGKGVIKSSEKVVLHQWNSLLIYRYRWDAWIELNEKRRNRGRSTGIFSRITFRESSTKPNLITQHQTKTFLLSCSALRFTSLSRWKRKLDDRNSGKEENSYFKGFQWMHQKVCRQRTPI